MKRYIKHFFQRKTRGWDDSETWNLDVHTAKFILPRLKKFRELNNGYPQGYTEESWNDVLDEMIWAMGEIAAGKQYIYDQEFNYDRLKAALEVFGKHFLDLWW